MNVRYIIDEKGYKNAVLLSIKDWEEIQNDLKEFERLNKDTKQKLSERFAGCIPEERVVELQDELIKMRNEWERNIY